ncbi:MAG: hypothetical protein D6729_04495 [Deltaproteobacteria bacterium]|nr:MAG: hypothetical protein D6729_04495 [Deltaproteobacteria bacterium]
MQRARYLRRVVDLDEESGQAAVEYATVTAAILGMTVLSWPFLVELLNGLNVYYQSIYWVLESPLP